jgi:ADP-heptose:LPS heptosyltransferase
LGDVLFTLPAVNAVRDQFPAARIDYLVSGRCAPLLEGFAGVSETLVFDRDVLRHWRPLAWWRATIGLALIARRARYDLVIDFHGFGETALLAFMTGAPRRWGTLEGKKLRRLAYTRVFPRLHVCHPVDHNLRFLRDCGLSTTGARNEFKLPAECLNEAQAVSAKLGFALEQPTIFIQPFTSDPQRNFPLERFLQFARYCKARRIQVLFGGGPSDRTRLVTALQDEFPVAAGAALLVTAGLMQLSKVIVGSDTGLVHLAVALRKRVVMLISSPQSAIPYGQPDWALHAPTGGTVADISVESLIEAANAALRGQGQMLPPWP